jgi:hypothetical protein
MDHHRRSRHRHWPGAELRSAIQLALVDIQTSADSNCSAESRAGAAESRTETALLGDVISEVLSGTLHHIGSSSGPADRAQLIRHTVNTTLNVAEVERATIADEITWAQNVPIDLR